MSQKSITVVYRRDGKDVVKTLTGQVSYSIGNGYLKIWKGTYTAVFPFASLVSFEMES